MLYYKVAVCDDDKEILNFMESAIWEFSKNEGYLFSVDVFQSGKGLCDFMQSGYTADLLFLDIEMATCNGLDVGSFIRNVRKNNMMKIVYISSHTQYAMDLFAIRPFHFLKKPLTKEIVNDILNQALEYDDISEGSFTYTENRDVYKIPIKDILFFRRVMDKTEIHARSEVIFINEALKSIYNRVKPYDFFYSDRSHLVSYARVIRFYYDQIELDDKTKLEISVRRRNEIKKMQIDLEMRKYT